MSLMWVERMILPPARCMACGTGAGRAAYFGDEDENHMPQINHLYLCEGCIFALPLQMANHPDFGLSVTKTVVEKADLAEMDRLLAEARESLRDALLRRDEAEKFARQAVQYQQPLAASETTEGFTPPPPVRAKARAR